MNASGEFLKSVVPHTLFGLPVCDLGWNATLSLVEGLVSLRGSRTTLAFLDERTLIHQAFDPDCRDRLERRLLLPSGSRALGLVAGFLHGRPAPVRFSARTFVPALLTFFDGNCRIGIAGEDAGRVEALREHFSRHTPWHQIVAILPDQEVDQRLDVVIVDARSAAEERRLERRLASVRTGLVVMAGSGLSRLIADRQERVVSGRALNTSGASFA